MDQEAEKGRLNHDLGHIVGPLETGIPMSRSRRGNGILRPRMQSMRVGNSFTTAYSTSAISRIAKQLGIKCETRKIRGGQIRVWRTE